MDSSTVEIEVSLRRRIDDDDQWSPPSQLHSSRADDVNDDGSDDRDDITAKSQADPFDVRVVFLAVHPQRCRIVWNYLQPILFVGGAKHGASLSRLLVRAVLQECPRILDGALPTTAAVACSTRTTRTKDRCFNNDNRQAKEKNNVGVTKYESETSESSCDKNGDDRRNSDGGILYRRFLVRKRRNRVLRVQRLRTRRLRTTRPSRLIRVRIEPPWTTMLEASWETRLVRWEHSLVQAQSVAGYLSTLGGAYFMCHRYGSATRLAVEQSRIASRVMHDTNMYNKCRIYQAYNYVYNSKFDDAVEILRDVRAQSEGKDDVVVRMCDSALLFCSRVRTMSDELKTDKPEAELLQDDLAVRQVVMLRLAFLPTDHVLIRRLLFLILLSFLSNTCINSNAITEDPPREGPIVGGRHDPAVFASSYQRGDVKRGYTLWKYIYHTTRPNWKRTVANIVRNI